MNTVKIKTSLESQFGTTLTTGKGPIEFNDEGIAEVSPETAKTYVGIMPSLSYVNAEDANIEVEEEAPVAETTSPAEEPAAEAPAPEQPAEEKLDEDGTLSQADEPNLDEVPTEETTAVSENKVEAEEKEPYTEGQKEEITAQLNALEINDIQDVLVKAGVPAREFSTIQDKDALVKFAVEKQVL